MLSKELPNHGTFKRSSPKYLMAFEQITFSRCNFDFELAQEVDQS